MPAAARLGLLAALALVPVGSPAKHAAAAGPPRVQTLCPVMTTDEIDRENSKFVEYRGVKVYLCCDTCVARFRRDPAAYLDPKLIPGLAGVELPKRDIAQLYCPVYPDRKVSSKDPFVMYKGVKVYVFNDTGRQRFEKDPERYARPELLPQLPRADKK